MAPTTPSSKSFQTPSKTPQSRSHRSHFHSVKPIHPSLNPNSATKENPPTDHPVEVVGRIRDYPDQKEKPISALHISSDHCNIRVRTDIGYRDFTLDGVSVSEEEDLDGFYKKFVESRINGVKLGAKCTIMTYGPTGAGKSHTMFGCSKQPGIVYRALRDILGEADEENETDNQRIGLRSFVQVSVLEIYNEEIYDLLSTNNGGGLALGWPKGTPSKVKLEVMGKKAKNATFISGNEAGKISREVAKVEKRRIVKSTMCNDRSSRSHCMIILDVPLVGGRLMLVDMAGSENIEQAGQIGFEAKMQTAKINQGNIALKRVVESIANGDSHVPFRDSKLTMLLQDSFEDDKSKILMILCASPDPKEIHKTMATLEYGAKAKCIVRGGHTPTKDKIDAEDSSTTVILGSKIAAMDEFIYKLQMENKRREKERNEAHRELLRKEEEVAALRAKLEQMEGQKPVISEEEINLKVKERTQLLKLELEKKLQECQKMANEFVELGRRRMEEKILQQQEEVEMLRRRLEEIESELYRSRGNNGEEDGLREIEGSNFAKRLLEIYSDGDQMEKSMDLDMGNKQPIVIHEVKEVDKSVQQTENFILLKPYNWTNMEEEEESCTILPKFPEKVCLSTVFEEEEGENGENPEEEEVEKEVVEEKAVQFSRKTDGSSPGINLDMGSFLQTPNSCTRDFEKADYSIDEFENSKDAASARRTRIQNIFMLCGNHRELTQHVRIPTPTKKRTEATETQSSPCMPNEDSISKSLSKEVPTHQTFPKPEFELRNRIFSDVTDENIMKTPNSGLMVEPFISGKLATEPKSIKPLLRQDSKENNRPEEENKDGLIEVYVKWEASTDYPGKFITKLKVAKDSSLADLRKLVETHLGEDHKKQGFMFLMLGDPTGAPVGKEKEASVQASKLPICNNQLSGHLACLRPVRAIQRPNHLPFSSLENKILTTSNSPSPFKQHVESFSPKVVQNFSPAPYVITGLHR
ncbi:Kinesin [Macleaya cordata]|uniref:Kinesin-like protein KIN-10A n=1 Tax=Macleaya cordata TaxID=56857 RepID=A0A200PVY6_MACCD|nr:Kinesin [Macleaya cordata]